MSQVQPINNGRLKWNEKKTREKEREERLATSRCLYGILPRFIAAVNWYIFLIMTSRDFACSLYFPVHTFAAIFNILLIHIALSPITMHTDRERRYKSDEEEWSLKMLLWESQFWTLLRIIYIIADIGIFC